MVGSVLAPLWILVAISAVAAIVVGIVAARRSKASPDGARRARGWVFAAIVLACVAATAAGAALLLP